MPILSIHRHACQGQTRGAALGCRAVCIGRHERGVFAVGLDLPGAKQSIELVDICASAMLSSWNSLSSMQTGGGCSDGGVLPWNDRMMVQESHVLKRARLDHDPGVQEYRFGG